MSECNGGKIKGFVGKVKTPQYFDGYRLIRTIVGTDDAENIGVRGKEPKGVLAPLLWLWSMNNAIEIQQDEAEM